MKRERKAADFERYNMVSANRKSFNGKAIYNPSGKAGEYSYWACNFYTGCSNDCDYCYCKRGIMSHVWSLTPTLKKCFKDEAHALHVFEKELQQNLNELQKHGLFFTFTSDPFLPETATLTMKAIRECHNNAIPVKVLTKRGDDNLYDFVKLWYDKGAINKNKIAFGFTLTGHDELEPNASTNAERIEAMQKLHDAGFKTWASIEPVIDTKSSLDIIEKIAPFCDLFKVGLLSGKKYKDYDLEWFIDWVVSFVNKSHSHVYFKDSLLKQAGINREDLTKNCVERYYNIFTNK